jgi:hypothetical protein
METLKKVQLLGLFQPFNIYGRAVLLPNELCHSTTELMILDDEARLEAYA